MLTRVLLAFEDVGLGIQLQESLESAGYDVTWDAAQIHGPTDSLAPAPDAVLLSGDPATAIAGPVAAWRKVDPVPGIVVMGSTQRSHDVCDAERVLFVPGTADRSTLQKEIEHAISLRFASGMTRLLALRALGLPASGDAGGEALQVIQFGREAKHEIVREALRWHTMHYVGATNTVAALRQHRALHIPEVEVCKLLTGTRTVQTVLRSGVLDPWQTARLLWSLASIQGVTLTEDPPDLDTHERRAITAIRENLQARYTRLQNSTFYDVLEITPAAGLEAVAHAGNMLALRYAPDRLDAVDLGDMAHLAKPLWEQIVKARKVLIEWDSRGRYNDWLREEGEGMFSEWAVSTIDEGAAQNAYARGQHALVQGEVFKAVSHMAAAARNHSHHPEIEAGLAWARYRADVTKGGDRTIIARRERAVAEKSLVGRRPWPRALLALGMLCAADNDPGAARWHLREALLADANLPAAKKLLARL